MPEPALRQQGARCMDCGVPFCQTGRLWMVPGKLDVQFIT